MSNSLQIYTSRLQALTCISLALLCSTVLAEQTFDQHKHIAQKNLSIHIHKPVIRLLPAVSTSTAAYFVIQNSGNKDIALLAANTAAAQSTEIHQTISENGSSRMSHLHKLAIAAGTSINFEPGSFHLMLLKLSAPLREGQQIPITFSFDNGESLTINFSVKKEIYAAATEHKDHD
jgi:hypothetical protein